MLNPVTNAMLYSIVTAMASIGAAAKDLSVRRIPNRLTSACAVFGLTMHWMLDGVSGLGSSAMSGLVLGTIFLVFYVAGGMGAGDVKLMGAVGCLSGMKSLSMILASTIVSGMLLALSIAIYRKQFLQTIENTLLLLRHHGQHGLQAHEDLNVSTCGALRMPFAVPIAAGCLISLGIELVH